MYHVMCEKNDKSFLVLNEAVSELCRSSFRVESEFYVDCGIVPFACQKLLFHSRAFVANIRKVDNMFLSKFRESKYSDGAVFNSLLDVSHVIFGQSCRASRSSLSSARIRA